MEKCTPMMEQYLNIKAQYKYCLLFYRLGDFYELFFEDAKIASRELELTLTGKDCGMSERAPMCGVPFHSADRYIGRLIEKGYKVAICEQVEDPKQAKGVVKREVIRVITPGTVLDTGILKEDKNNYIVCAYENKKGTGIAVCDVSTGEFSVTQIDSNSPTSLFDEVARFYPSEFICNRDFSLQDMVTEVFDLKPNVIDESSFDYSTADICLCNHFNILNLDSFGINDMPLCVISAGALMSYLKDTQKNNLSHISTIKRYTGEGYMLLDISSRRNLELTSTMRDNSKKGSLLWVLDKTKTAMGARLLRKWLSQPLTYSAEINKRLDGVEALKDNAFLRADLRDALTCIFDIERLIGRVVYKTANARDLVALKDSFRVLPQIKSILSKIDCDFIKTINEGMHPLDHLYDLIEKNIEDEPPMTVREGGIIKLGAHEEIDKLRKAKDEGSGWLLELEAKEKQATDIPKLKIKYNKVFGYFIEVTNSFLNKVPERYIRKQTLTNCERYITPELKEIEDTILNAGDKLSDLEYELFSKVRDTVANNIELINRTAEKVAICDVLCSLAETAEENGYVRPEIKDNRCLDIVNGRHPVVEKMLKAGESFIPNDTHLDGWEKRFGIVTGPNMAGKSTYMRQTALIVLMAQIGSFVPADKAEISVVDRIFTRVGASDDLATGQSTFMVEMMEVANILNNATKDSLLILDEIGRGTSTYDGLSIAWAVLEHIAYKVCARTLFATHYHELTGLEGRVPGIKNFCVSVKEKGEKVIFMRKIVDGMADKSYGVHVAKLAGVPKRVTERATELLELLSNNSDCLDYEKIEKEMVQKMNTEEDYVYPPPKKQYVNTGNALDIAISKVKSEAEVEKIPEAAPVDKDAEEIKNIIVNLDINNMTPMEALKVLYDLKARC